MSRLLMTAFGGLLCGVALWCVVGFLAVQILAKMGVGAHDGGGAMSGFFFIGGMGGLVGAIVGAWMIWRVLAEPSRTGTVGGWLIGLLVVLVAGVMFAMTPTHVESNDFPPGKRGEFQVEAKFPTSRIAGMGKQESITFELRAGGFFLAVPWQHDQIRQESDRTIVPGTFRVQVVRQWILGIMNGEKQIDATTVGIDRFNDTMQQTTEWSPWTPTDSGLEVRWRFAVLAR